MTSPLPSEPAPAQPGSFIFLRKFLRHGTQVASVAPSSRRLALALCHYVTPDRPQTILELGAGTGAVTAVVAERMHPHSRLLAVEMDPDFAAVLRRRDPQAQVIEADAATTLAHLQAVQV
ncbi:MAG TPA: rRNA adenine N-6-methyltransferase family protein, partial [Anaerolineae bacterium]|nr:rRNA adenine N-6-methyltransferase family protein [Anaerolineae bacterium]